MSFVYNVAIFSPMFVSLFWAILLLLVPGKSNKAKHFLGMFMIGAFVVYLSHAIFFSKQIELYLFFDPIYVFATLSVYPLFFWYIKLLTVNNKYELKMLWHFVVPFIFSVAMVIVYCLMENPTGYIKHFLYQDFETGSECGKYWKLQHFIFGFSRIFMFLQVAWVLWRGLLLIRNYKSRLKEFYSNLEGRSVDWAKWTILIFAITALMTSMANILGRAYFAVNSVLLFVPACIFSVLLFLIGYLGHMQRHSVYDFNIDVENEGKQNMVNKVVDFDEEMQVEVELLMQRIIDAFEKKKLYRLKDLKISALCEHLNTNRTYVSRVLNEFFDCSFSDIVNKYRVEEAKKHIEMDIDEKLTLEAIAEKVGYASAGTLIRNFKNYFGYTPGTLRNKKRVLPKKSK
ncbi:MAG TPA: helix-turn-helix transcriptional regulator [Prolixibacteraceae bacterium]|nr:helix-turn-helix transcriptional regulator [Prolixibacteraceae bacterium]